MNRTAEVVFFIGLSLIFIVLQSTVFSPNNRGFFYPDLNLILILFLAVFSETKGGAIIALGNGYIMDVLAGYTVGVHTLSRLSVFAVVRGVSERVYSQRKTTQGLVLFLSTLFLWAFVWAVVEIRTDLDFDLSFSRIVAEGAVNTAVGLPLFWMMKKLYARVQK